LKCGRTLLKGIDAPRSLVCADQWPRAQLDFRSIRNSARKKAGAGSTPAECCPHRRHRASGPATARSLRRDQIAASPLARQLDNDRQGRRVPAARSAVVSAVANAPNTAVGDRKGCLARPNASPRCSVPAVPVPAVPLIIIVTGRYQGLARVGEVLGSVSLTGAVRCPHRAGWGGQKASCLRPVWSRVPAFDLAASLFQFARL
jgi:hypothetical protein